MVVVVDVVVVVVVVVVVGVVVVVLLVVVVVVLVVVVVVVVVGMNGGIVGKNDLSLACSLNPGGRILDTSSCIMGTSGETLSPPRTWNLFSVAVVDGVGGGVVVTSCSAPVAKDMGKTDKPFRFVLISKG